MRELHEFQSAFVQAILRPPLPEDGVAWSIHRNTVTKSLVDALGANYPTVAQLVGRQWFDACAVEYVRATPPKTPALVLYGETFPSFLSGFEPAQELPYLSEVARIDRLWIESYTARDAQPLNSRALTGLSADALAEQRLALHPATRCGWFQHSAATIWLHHRAAPAGVELEIEDQEEGLLLTRPEASVESLWLDRVAYTFLNELSTAAPLGDAATTVLALNAHADVAGALARLLTAGAFILSGDS